MAQVHNAILPRHMAGESINCLHVLLCRWSSQHNKLRAMGISMQRMHAILLCKFGRMGTAAASVFVTRFGIKSGARVENKEKLCYCQKKKLSQC